jgi:hypothetical protein
MRVFNVAKASPWRTAVMATVLTGAMAGSAFAAVSDLTMDSTAALSPGRLHATLTGTVTCDAGTTVFLGAQIVQSGVASGYGGSSLACDGKAQEYTADVSTGGSGYSRPVGRTRKCPRSIAPRWRARRNTSTPSFA